MAAPEGCAGGNRLASYRNSTLAEMERVSLSASACWSKPRIGGDRSAESGSTVRSVSRQQGRRKKNLTPAVGPASRFGPAGLGAWRNQTGIQKLLRSKFNRWSAVIKRKECCFLNGSDFKIDGNYLPPDSLVAPFTDLYCIFIQNEAGHLKHRVDLHKKKFMDVMELWSTITKNFFK